MKRNKINSKKELINSKNDELINSKKELKLKNRIKNELKKELREKKKLNKIPPQDGGIDDKTKERIRKAIREVWMWTSHARKLVLRRCLLPTGFSQCENTKCLKIVPKVFVDHIEPCGAVDSGYIDRTFVSSSKMQGLCKKCHDAKTKYEKNLREIGL